LSTPYTCHTGHCGRATSAQATDTPVSGRTRVALTSQTLLLSACTSQNRIVSVWQGNCVVRVNAVLRSCVTAVAQPHGRVPSCGGERHCSATEAVARRLVSRLKSAIKTQLPGNRCQVHVWQHSGPCESSIKE
jgi:hypothetical protein